MNDAHNRQFSLPLYILIVCGVSWPFQLPFLLFGNDFRPVLLLSMVMAGVGTWIAGRFVFKNGFANAGWRIGRPWYYFLALVLALLLWLFPVAIELAFGIHVLPEEFSISILTSAFLLTFFLTLIPAFGEELSWRGYLLPNLLQQHTPRKALLIHAFVTWFWHLPFLLAMGMQMDGYVIISVSAVLLVSFVPALMHAVVFAWFWARSGSLLVVTFYHSAFDEVRDSLQAVIGFAWFAENWQMLVLTVLGIALLWRSQWITHTRKPGTDHV